MILAEHICQWITAIAMMSASLFQMSKGLHASDHTGGPTVLASMVTLAVGTIAAIGLWYR